MERANINEKTRKIEKEIAQTETEIKQVNKELTRKEQELRSQLISAYLSTLRII